MGKPQYVAGLDAGSTRTRCPVALLEGSCLRLVGYGEAPAAGWSRGRIADPKDLAESFRSAIAAAEASAGAPVESAVVGMGGTTVQGMTSRGLYEMGRPREIGEVDVRYAIQLASHVQLAADRQILQILPQDFAVDGRANYWNPIGTTGSRLEAFVHIVTTSAREHHAIVNASHQAHLAVEDTLYEPLAAAYAAVLPDDRGEGVAVIDIGAHSTDLVVYWGDALLSSVSLPISGDHFTRDVSHGLCIGFDDAQQLKEECGCALLGLTSDSSVIVVPGADGRPAREATRRDLNLILEARAEELFAYVKRELQHAQLEGALANGVVLTGAGAMMAGMCDMAERVLNCQARNGLPVGIRDWPEEIDNPAWTTAAGLMMYAARLRHREENGNGKAGLLKRLLQ